MGLPTGVKSHTISTRGLMPRAGAPLLLGDGRSTAGKRASRGRHQAASSRLETFQMTTTACSNAQGIVSGDRNAWLKSLDLHPARSRSVARRRLAPLLPYRARSSNTRVAIWRLADVHRSSSLLIPEVYYDATVMAHFKKVKHVYAHIKASSC